MTQQLPLFSLPDDTRKPTDRSGTFVDNMRLPIHRWFRYSAGFSADWAESIINSYVNPYDAVTVLDPFSGSGTTLLAADKLGAASIGIEAHPFIVRVAKAKLLWASSVSELGNRADAILDLATNLSSNVEQYPRLIHQCYSSEALNELDKLKQAWLEMNDGTSASELSWLALTSILRPTASVGTAQWQYILPNKSKKAAKEPIQAFTNQIMLMQNDMKTMQQHMRISRSKLFQGDARSCNSVKSASVDLVITSPPYANNYDYADATRFEMSFWGEVAGWGDLHEAVRQYLIVSSSQHASKEKLDLDICLNSIFLAPIQDEISAICRKLADERHLHGGKKHYHTMIAAYFIDMARVWHELRRICRPQSNLFFVIGDSAPYGIHVPVERWLGELAINAGFLDYKFDILRQRNTKWENRKHRVPLHEGILEVHG